MVAFGASDTVYPVPVDVAGRKDPFPSAADWLRLVVVFPCAGGGLYGPVRSGAKGQSGPAGLDALIITAGSRELPVGMGREFGQGYLFAKPLPYPEATKLALAERVAAQRLSGECVPDAVC
jgi:hypothetical protein